MQNCESSECSISPTQAFAPKTPFPFPGFAIPDVPKPTSRPYNFCSFSVSFPIRYSRDRCLKLFSLAAIAEAVGFVSIGLHSAHSR